MSSATSIVNIIYCNFHFTTIIFVVFHAVLNARCFEIHESTTQKAENLDARLRERGRAFQQPLRQADFAEELSTTHCHVTHDSTADLPTNNIQYWRCSHGHTHIESVLFVVKYVDLKLTIRQPDRSEPNIMTPSPQSDVFVGRQPIYDTELNIVAYELLFRSTTENQASIQDADVATSQLLINSVIEIGLENLVFGLPAFVNFTQNFLNGRCEIPFDPELLVIEVLETVEPDDETIASLIRWRDLGFTIALDDYIESDIRARLLQLADIVKVDLVGFDREKLKREVSRLRELPLKLLAEKVETVDEFELCKSLGFDYFQGYFLSRPQIVEGRSLANNQLSILQLLVKLRDPAVTFDEVVDLVKRDVSLSIKLLRYVNSLAHGVRRQIDSVRQAAIRLGLQKICQIVTLLAMNGISTKPRPILETALIRAKMCELLGSSIRPDAPEICFTVGLFSTLDAFLDRPLPEILKQLPLTTEIRGALIERSGPMGRLLNSVMAFERGDWDATRDFGASDASMQSAYLNAVAWAHVESSVAQSTSLPADK